MRLLTSRAEVELIYILIIIDIQSKSIVIYESARGITATTEARCSIKTQGRLWMNVNLHWILIFDIICCISNSVFVR